MATRKVEVIVPVEWFEAGHLPQVCGRTGGPTTETRPTVARRKSGLVMAAPIFGVAGMVLARALAEQVTGPVPYRNPDLDKRLTAAGGLAMAASLGLMIFLRSHASALGLGVVGIVAASALLVAVDVRSVKAELSKDRASVTLKNVHPDFARAVHMKLANAMKAAQQRPSETAESPALDSAGDIAGSRPRHQQSVAAKVLAGVAAGAAMLLVVASAAVFVVIRLGDAAAVPADPSPAATALVALDTTGIEVLAAGDCFNANEAGVAEADCSSHHVAEVFRTQGDAGPNAVFPGDSEMVAYANEFCHEGFEGYVGVAREKSVLDVIAIYPSEATWQSGNQTISCYVIRSDGYLLSNSVRASGL